MSKSIKVISSKEEVEAFLHDLISVLNRSDFDRNDVLHQLMSLVVSEYLETFIDDKDPSWPPFFVFARSIKRRDIYIKVKIRDRVKEKVFCVSFHFARHPFPDTLPYA